MKTLEQTIDDVKDTPVDVLNLVSRWAINHPKLLVEMTMGMGIETGAMALGMACSVLYQAYMYGLPSDLEDIVPEQYRR